MDARSRDVREDRQVIWEYIDSKVLHNALNWVCAAMLPANHNVFTLSTALLHLRRAAYMNLQMYMGVRGAITVSVAFLFVLAIL
jgi:hypothetical protein